MALTQQIARKQTYIPGSSSDPEFQSEEEKRTPHIKPGGVRLSVPSFGGDIGGAEWVQ